MKCIAGGLVSCSDEATGFCSFINQLVSQGTISLVDRKRS